MVGPLRQDPQPKKPAPLQLEPEYGGEEAPKSKPMTVGGFAENTIKDAFGLLKGLYDIIPSTAKRIKEIAENPQQYAEDFKLLFGTRAGSARDTFGYLWDSVTEPYKTHGARVLYERPVNTVLDALTILSAGGASIAKIGKVGNIQKLIQAGEFIQKAPGQMMRRAIDKATSGVTGGKWDLAKRREFLAIKSHEQGRAAVEIENSIKTVGAKIGQLSNEEAALFHKFRTQGGTAAEVAANPKVADALESYRGMVTKWQDELKARKMLAPERVEGALVKKRMVETGEDVATARAAIQSAEVKPVYGPSLFEGKANLADDIADEMVRGSKAIRTGGVGFLEEFKGQKGAIADPRVYVPKAIEAFHKMEAKVRTSERLLQSGELIKAKPGVSGGEALTRESVPEGVFRRYYEDRIRAQALKQITDPTIKRLLKWEYTKREGGLVRLYDHFIRIFSKMATRWNPQWYTGQVVGDAVLGALGGSAWIKGRQALRARAMPPEVLARMGMADTALTAKPSFMERAADLGNSIDQATRAGIISQSMAKDLKAAGVSFEAMAETMAETIRASDNFSEVQVRLQLLKEGIARRSPDVRRVDREIARLMKQEEKALAKYNKASAATPGKPSAARQSANNALNEIRQNVVNLEAKRSAILSDISSDLMKAGKMEAQLPGLRQQAEIVRRGVDRANTFIGDYLALDGFEQQVMKRLIPFYSWTKAMTMLAFRIPFIAPTKTFLWHRYAQVMMQQVDDPEMPEWTRGLVPLFGTKDGNTVWIKTDSLSPFAGLRSSEAFGVPIPGMFNIVERNPLISLIYRGAGGKTVWDAGTLPYGEQLVNLTNGEVVEFTQGGKLKKVVPQDPLVSSVVHMFPIAQFAENLLTPYWTNKHNWLGFPEPILNADGTWKYPRELTDMLSGLAGVKLMSRKPEDMIRGEKIRVTQAIRSLEKSYAKASPEEREFIKQALQDYSGGSYRKFESR